ncbi:helicase-exonuclease AddAB subunit AddB [Paenalkalicoccus suaedae]|uniref:ATP-dependent helicase/deoxyribonuclease subunit B n=1 Tax=Paenalkalicoccus suaedae TaxID=2592382 RepID=A0A859FE87_9BACI|nr:helicase-exonuclease AddAB subunit AddB [Paenalkalicoccus suaedae]QKS71190.1 helicase-exonuclease AddAB subunit AddB [Paenalkalicoccus suaedae]
MHIYTGRSGTGKSYALLHKAVEEAKQNPFGKPIYFLVPDQMTFQVERSIIRLLKATTRIQVVSFKRLGLRVLQEVGGASLYQLSKSGIHALLRKIVEEERESLVLYQKAASHSGFIEQLETTFTEWNRYNVTKEAVQETLDKLQKKERSNEEEIMLSKLSDLNRIKGRLDEELHLKYTESEDHLRLLSEKVPNSSKLQSASLYIDGFHSFTPIELQVLQSLIEHVNQVHIALTLDPNDASILHPLDLFYETTKTYQQVKQLANDLGRSIDETSFTDTHRFSSEALIHVEKNSDVRPINESNATSGIRFAQAVNERTEIAYVARRIQELVKSGDYRYRDIAIVARNPKQYQPYIETICNREQIPYFMDEKRSVLNHPLAEFIRSILEVVDRNFPYEAVFRMLKTELLFNQVGSRERDYVDQLENYVLAYGIRGNQWREENAWTFRRNRTRAEDEDQNQSEIAVEQAINEWREALLPPVRGFMESINQAKTAKEYVHALFSLLETIDAPAKLKQLQEYSFERNKLREYREHEQIWKEVVSLFEQIVMVSGDEKLEFHTFIQMIEAGLSSMQFTTIPPAFDQIVVADMENSRLSQVKVTFLIGMNDGVLPSVHRDDGMLSDTDRKFFHDTGIELAESSEEKLMNESFLFYRAITLPSDKLFLSYSLADSEGKKRLPSMYIKPIQDMFPQVELESIYEQASDNSPNEERSFVTTPKATLTHLSSELQAFLKGYHIHDYWFGAYNWFIDQKDAPLQTLQSLYYSNTPKQLSVATAKKLYGEKLSTSVSRLEQYNRCPFSQYAGYGLRLKERDTYKLEAPDIGTLFHAALKEMADELQKDRRDFRDLHEADAKRMAKTVVESIAPRIQRNIFAHSNRYKYIFTKLQEVVARASQVLGEQARQSGFVPAGLEVGFGPNQPLPPFRFKLQDGTEMELIGRIDRVDRADINESTYVRVIDYKSSKRDINLDDVYFGLALQMLVYLDVVVSMSSSWLNVTASPAGVLYFHVHNPMLKTTEKLTLEELEKKLLKEFKMKGYVASDKDVIHEMDHQLEGHSSVIPVQIKKDGQLVESRSSTLSEEDYSLLQSHLREHITHIGEAIVAGDISLTPYKKQQQIACTYCPYKDVCQFDATVDTFKQVPKVDDKEILAMLKQKEGEHDDH